VIATPRHLLETSRLFGTGHLILLLGQVFIQAERLFEPGIYTIKNSILLSLIVIIECGSTPYIGLGQKQNSSTYIWLLNGVLKLH
jgi:hypothetical protein